MNELDLFSASDFEYFWRVYTWYKLSEPEHYGSPEYFLCLTEKANPILIIWSEIATNLFTLPWCRGFWETASFFHFNFLSPRHCYRFEVKIVAWKCHDIMKNCSTNPKGQAIYNNVMTILYQVYFSQKDSPRLWLSGHLGYTCRTTLNNPGNGQWHKVSHHVVMFYMQTQFHGFLLNISKCPLHLRQYTLPVCS